MSVASPETTTTHRGVSLQRSSSTVRRACLSVLLLCCACAASAEDGIHPAHLSEADLTAVQRAIAEGADPRATHIAGGTALHHLVTVSAQMGLTGLMIRDQRIVRPGQWDVSGHEAVAAYLLEHGADIDARDADGKTALHVAALTGHAAAARFLLERGAEPALRDARGWTPQDWANWSASDEAIRELATATGARIDAAGVRRRAAAVLEVLGGGSAAQR